MAWPLERQLTNSKIALGSSNNNENIVWKPWYRGILSVTNYKSSITFWHQQSFKFWIRITSETRHKFMMFGSAGSGFQSSSVWLKSSANRRQSFWNFPMLTIEPAEQAEMELLSTVATIAPKVSNSYKTKEIMKYFHRYVLVQFNI